ncbi:MAG: hypothetical protein HYY37_02915 [Candidatus Aenigmarchaeota archaeon]|nr:hypothetical protein [Candidatus Aenigmarchaeota archaeon]
MKREITRIDPGSAAKVFAVFYGMLGIVYAFFFALLSLFAPMMAGFGVLFALFFFVIMVALGALLGFLVALAYNFGAKRWGGLKLDVK